MIKNKKDIVILTLMVFIIFFVGIISSVHSLDFNENTITSLQNDPTLEITSPKLGYLSVFGGNIPIFFLETLNWGMVIDAQLCVETSSSGTIDYVIFNLSSSQGDLLDSKIDYDSPYECCFNNDISRSFHYDITATAYVDDSISATDEVGPIAFIKTGQAPPSMGTLVLQLTDDPPKLNITQALVTISQVKVHQSARNESGQNDTNTSAGWKTIVNESQTFDLIELQDATVFFGSNDLSAGWYTQIRLMVEKAVVTIDGEEYNLTIPSKMVHLITPFKIEEDSTTTLTLDFDVHKSVIKTGNDQYIMRPTITVIQE